MVLCNVHVNCRHLVAPLLKRPVGGGILFETKWVAYKIDGAGVGRHKDPIMGFCSASFLTKMYQHEWSDLG